MLVLSFTAWQPILIRWTFFLPLLIRSDRLGFEYGVHYEIQSMEYIMTCSWTTSPRSSLPLAAIDAFFKVQILWTWKIQTYILSCFYQPNGRFLPCRIPVSPQVTLPVDWLADIQSRFDDWIILTGYSDPDNVVDYILLAYKF